MKPGKLIVAGMAAGAISLFAATPALASGIPLNALSGDIAVAPDHEHGGKPDNAGPSNRPDDPGNPNATPDADAGGDAGAEGDAEGDTEITRGNRPADAGRPDDAGPTARTVPVLPENASPRAHAAVTAAFEQQAAIQERVAAIRGLETGPGRADAMNALMADFGELLHSVSDAVQAVETGGGNDAEADDTDEGSDAALLGEDDGTDDGDGDETDDGSGDGTDDGSGDDTDDGDGDGDETDDGSGDDA